MTIRENVEIHALITAASTQLQGPRYESEMGKRSYAEQLIGHSTEHAGRVYAACDGQYRNP